MKATPEGTVQETIQNVLEDLPDENFSLFKNQFSMKDYGLYGRMPKSQVERASTRCSFAGEIISFFTEDNANEVVKQALRDIRQHNLVLKLEGNKKRKSDELDGNFQKKVKMDNRENSSTQSADPDEVLSRPVRTFDKYYLSDIEEFVDANRGELVKELRTKLHTKTFEELKAQLRDLTLKPLRFNSADMYNVIETIDKCVQRSGRIKLEDFPMKKVLPLLFSKPVKQSKPLNQAGVRAPLPESTATPSQPSIANALPFTSHSNPGLSHSPTAKSVGQTAAALSPLKSGDLTSAARAALSPPITDTFTPCSTAQPLFPTPPTTTAPSPGTAPAFHYPPPSISANPHASIAHAPDLTPPETPDPCRFTPTVASTPSKTAGPPISNLLHTCTQTLPPSGDSSISSMESFSGPFPPCTASTSLNASNPPRTESIAFVHSSSNPATAETFPRTEVAAASTGSATALTLSSATTSYFSSINMTPILAEHPDLRSHSTSAPILDPSSPCTSDTTSNPAQSAFTSSFKSSVSLDSDPKESEIPDSLRDLPRQDLTNSTLSHTDSASQNSGVCVSQNNQLLFTKDDHSTVILAPKPPIQRTTRSKATQREIKFNAIKKYFADQAEELKIEDGEVDEGAMNRSKYSLNRITERRHKQCQCLIVEDIILYKDPVDRRSAILDIKLPKPLNLSGSLNKSVHFGEVFTKARNFSEKEKFCLNFNMGVVGSARKTTVYFYGAKEPIEQVKFSEQKFEVFTDSFKRCFSELFVPVIALYKDVQNEILQHKLDMENE